MSILMARHSKVKLMALCLAILLLWVSKAWAAPQRSMDDWLTIINQLYAEEKYDDLLKQCNKALKEYPDDEGLLQSRGVVLLKTGQRDKALADFTKILDMDSENIDAYIGMALISACDGDMKDSWDYFEHAISIDDKHAPLYMWRGRMYYGGIADFEGALKDYELARQYVTPDRKAELLDLIMKTYRDYSAYFPEYRQNVVDAATELLAIEDISPAYARDAYTRRMEAYKKMNKYAEALADSQKLLELRREAGLETADVLALQGELLYDMQSPEEAKRLTLKALQQDNGTLYPRYYETDPDFAAYPIREHRGDQPTNG